MTEAPPTITYASVVAIAIKMKNVRAAFKILPDGTSVPNGYQKISCHMIFDVKMEDFRQKARLVAGGHMTKAPPTITYASVVSLETVCLALTIAAATPWRLKSVMCSMHISPHQLPRRYGQS